MENKISKVSLLWVIIMVGFMAHIITDMLPVFMIGMAFFVPMCGLVCMNYRTSKTMRVINLVLACAMMLFNIFHISELFIEFNPVQILIHPVMVVLGIYLFIYSLRLVKQKS